MAPRPFSIPVPARQAGATASTASNAILAERSPEIMRWKPLFHEWEEWTARCDERGSIEMGPGGVKPRRRHPARIVDDAVATATMCTSRCRHERSTRAAMRRWQWPTVLERDL